MYKLTLFISIVLVFNSSCKKSSEPEPESARTYANYSALKVGNYWVYGEYETDEQGKETYYGARDSVVISDTVMIRGNTYWVKSTYFDSKLQYVSYLRDSLSYLVNSYGRILFSSEDYNVLGANYAVFGADTAGRYEFYMARQDETIQVPAGTFKTRNYTQKVYLYPDYVNGDSIRYAYFKYAEGIGLVYSSYFGFSSTNAFGDRRLLRYYVAK